MGLYEKFGFIATEFMNYKKIITIESNKHSGKLCICGMWMIFFDINRI